MIIKIKRYEVDRKDDVFIKKIRRNKKKIVKKYGLMMKFVRE